MIFESVAIIGREEDVATITSITYPAIMMECVNDAKSQGGAEEAHGG